MVGKKSKKFYFVSNYQHKEDAQARAKAIRKRGFSARVKAQEYRDIKIYAVYAERSYLAKLGR